jgi:branched-chain amino acid transport system substrate-binding protein
LLDNEKQQQSNGGDMKKILNISFVICLLIVFVSGMTLSQDMPVFRIGVIDDVNGEIANGARLAVQEINRAGGVVGADGTTFLLELVVQPPDPEGNIEGAVANITQSEVIAVLGPKDTDTVLNNLQLLQGIGVPVITPAVGDTILASDSSELLFRSRATEFLQGRALALYLTEDIGLTNIVTVQLDVASTAAVVGFSTAVSALGVTPQQNLLFAQGMQVSDLVEEILAATPEAAAVYGAPEIAAELYNQLRESGWTGVFTYNQAQNETFQELIPLRNLVGILGTDTWSTGAADPASQAFIVRYVNATGEAPTSVAAATYDSVQLIALALGEPGTLGTNISGLESIQGVQGVLNPINLARGETSDNVLVLRLNEFGGADVAAKFEGSVRIPLEGEGVVEVGTPVPTLTPTLEGVFVVIRSPQQNVRTGPGLEYEILGQLQQGESRPVIGANIDFTWVVIEFRGQNGWLSTAPNLLELFGDRDSVPVVTPPPLPTPVPVTPSATPPGGTGGGTVPVVGFPDIVIVSATPSEVLVNTTSNITVTMRNNGDQNAGPFAVAASFPPNNHYSAQNFPGLAAGAQQTFLLSIQTGGQTGNFVAVIVADLNNQLNEGPTGEANNNAFQYTYRIDRAYISSSLSLTTGASVDLDSNGNPDINYDGAGLNTNAPCTGNAFCIGVMSPALNFNTAHYDAVASATGINANSVPNSSLTVGATLGLITDSGRRAVIRIDALNPGVSVSITYRVYNP